ncbi:LacI family transcriptional regulator [Mycetocola sp. BIGb0189]|uniref:LacI family DNA-binding transcriptional regulator n=1 Tax=Mycetocola sp. BIGb0189 TaxID=2940604 RepID=UPI002166F742|nr:substrate-binding domain-containing protein [Mycetocola sp. BIGb0189]MCS4276711.1 LacI family transcriptional regulator [Mycetocola sp. BIGb0189]
MTHKRATLAQVAAQAGVSMATVSKVLNGRDDVAAATRIRVQAVIDEVGYEAPGRRREAPAGPRLIDFVCEELDSDYALEVLRGVVEAASEIDVDIVVSQARTDRVDSGAWARRLADAGRTGMVLITSRMTVAELAEFRRLGMPVVVVDPFSPIDEGFVSVGSTNWAGGRAATDHLADLGHRRIAYIGGPEIAECHVARLHGYLASLRAHGIEPRADYVIPGTFHTESGVAGMAALMDLEEPPTAIFAASDSIAVGVFEEAARRGLRIPEDLSVIGFDGTALGLRTIPPLTTVAQPLRDIGHAALRLVLEQSRDGLLDSHHMELATTLITRASTDRPALV